MRLLILAIAAIFRPKALLIAENLVCGSSWLCCGGGIRGLA